MDEMMKRVLAVHDRFSKLCEQGITEGIGGDCVSMTAKGYGEVFPGRSSTELDGVLFLCGEKREGNQDLKDELLEIHREVRTLSDLGVVRWMGYNGVALGWDWAERLFPDGPGARYVRDGTEWWFIRAFERNFNCRREVKQHE